MTGVSSLINNLGTISTGYDFMNIFRGVLVGIDTGWSLVDYVSTGITRYIKEAIMAKQILRTLSGLFLIIALMGSFGAASAQDTNDGDNECRLDKVSTINEIEGAGLQRIEVGGNGTQHVDYYVPGVQSVSYIVGPQEVPFIWWGHGSIWEGNGAECESFDYVADAQAYAQGRLDSGHSGVVVDLRDGQVYNEGNLTDDEVNTLLEVHKSAISGNMDNNGDGQGDGNGQPTECTSTGEAYGGLEGCMPDTGTPASDTDAVRNDGDNATSVEPVQATHPPVVGESWTVGGDGATIVNFWTNEPGQDQAERKLFLEEGQTVNLMGGGTSWSYPVGSEDQARDEFEANGLPEVTLDELESEGLVDN